MSAGPLSKCAPERGYLRRGSWSQAQSLLHLKGKTQKASKRAGDRTLETGPFSYSTLLLGLFSMYCTLTLDPRNKERSLVPDTVCEEGLPWFSHGHQKADRRHTGVFRQQCHKEQDSPGIEECSIQERPVVVVPNKVRHLDGPGATGGLEICVNLNLVFRIPNIHQKYVKVQHGVWGDHASWKRIHAEILSPGGPHKHSDTQDMANENGSQESSSWSQT